VAVVGFIPFLALDAKGGVMEEGWSFILYLSFVACMTLCEHGNLFNYCVVFKTCYLFYALC
jgi:hypothetical protein